MNNINRYRKAFSLASLFFVLFSSVFGPFSPLLVNVLAADYEVELVDITTSSLQTSEEAVWDLVLLNTGELSWSTAAEALTYRWVDSSLVETEGEQTPLIADVLPGDSTDPAQQISVTAPATAGDYQLVLDLIAGGVRQNLTPTGIDITITPAPQTPTLTGGVELVEITPDEVKVLLSLNGESIGADIDSYKLSQSSDLSSENWQSTVESASFTKQTEFTIPNVSGTTSWYAQVQNTAGLVSDIVEISLVYTEPTVEPALSLEFEQEPLLGEDLILQAELSNTGSEIGYAGTIELTLPDGVEFIEATIPQHTGIDPVAPSVISGNRVVWDSFTNLNPGESYPIAFRLSVAGEPTFYINDLLSLSAVANIKQELDGVEVWSETTSINGKIQAFRVETSQDSGHNEMVTGTTEDNQVDRQIEIQNNPDRDSNTTEETIDPETEEVIEAEDRFVTVREILANGLEYIVGSQSVTNGIVHTFNVLSGDELLNGGHNGETILEWVLTGLTTDHNDAPIIIKYKFGIPYAVREGFDEPDDTDYDNSGDPVEHNQTFDIETEIEGFYTTRDEQSARVELNDTDTVQAKFINVTKSADKYEVIPGDVVTYTLKIRTSEYYSFTALEVADLLPDGLEFLAADLPVASGYPIIAVDGTTELLWEIPELAANSSYEFSYTATVLDAYSTSDSVISNDRFTNAADVDGVWTDETTAGNTGDAADADTAYTKTPRPEIVVEVWDVLNSEWTDQIDATIADEVTIRGTVTFPADVPTESVGIVHQLPPYTELITGAVTLSDSGDFSGSADVISFNGLDFDLYALGDTLAGATWTWEGSVSILDADALAAGTLVRDLLRVNYVNTADATRVERAEATIQIVEPDVVPSKRVSSGYLAAGETATVLVEIQNYGDSTAYGFSFTDTDFTSAAIVDGTFAQVSGDAICAVGLDTDTFSSEVCDLAPGDMISYSYDILLDESVITGTDIDSVLTLHDYYSGAGGSGRLYPESNLETNWSGQEPAIVTDLSIVDLEGNDLDSIGRAEDLRLIFTVENVGAAPSYNIALDTGHYAEDGWVFEIDRGHSDDVSETTIDSETSTWTQTELLPGEQIQIWVEYTTATDLPFDRIYPAEIVATAENKLADSIRLDASSELPADTDDDDYSYAEFLSVKRDELAPTGNITFYQDGAEVTAVKDLSGVTMELSATDIAQAGVDPKGVKAFRWWVPTSGQPGEVSAEWITLSDLATGTDCEAWTECNVWDGTAFTIDFSAIAEYEGLHPRYFEIIDIDGNIGLVGGTLIYDITAPGDDGGTLIGHFDGDVSNPEFTNDGFNYLAYAASDSLLGADDTELMSYEVSGVNSVRFSTDGSTYGSWVTQDLEGIVATRDYDWGTVVDGQVLDIHMQVRDAAGNVGTTTFTDTIVVELGIPEVSIELNSGAAYTGITLVDAHIPASDPASTTGLISGVIDMRLASCDVMTDCELELPEADWEPYVTDNIQTYLDILSGSGNKFVCVQVRDAATNESEVACDEIIFDATAPTGNVFINGGAGQTSNKNVVVELIASDPNHLDGSVGFGAVEFRLSTDGILWQSWQTLTGGDMDIDFTLAEFIGEANVYAQFRDGLENVSSVYQATININPGIANGRIVINDDATFTNTATVTLQMKPAGTPSHMKIWNQYENSADVAKELYQEFKHWNLTEDLGVKRVYVQYFYGSEAAEPEYDEIILAPRYAVEYYDTAHGDDSYTLSNFPTTALSADYIKVNLGVENEGSLTWLPQTGTSGEHPVNISYHWYQADGVTEYQYNGNRAVLGGTVSYQQSRELQLEVLTPILPGDYVLKIDTVHEGITWFSDYGNDMPTFNITIDENTDYPLADILGEHDHDHDHLDEEDYDGEFGVGGTAQHVVVSGNTYTKLAEQYYQCSKFGKSNKAYYGGDHLNENECWYPIYDANRHLYDGLYIPPSYYSHQWDLMYPGWVLVIPNVPDTWDAQFINQSTKNIVVKQGDSVRVRTKFKNVGTGTWKKSFVKLGTQNPQNRSSQLQATNWQSPQRTGTYAENVSALPNSTVNFYFDFQADLNETVGHYSECFSPLAEGKSWMKDDKVCWNVTVIPRELKTGEIFCTLGTDLLDAPNGSIIATVPYQAEVTILQESGTWGKVELASGEQGWIDMACFSQTGTVPNGQESSSDAAYEGPTGQNGIVLATTGVKLRYGPSLKFRWDTEIPYGVEVKVLRQTEAGDDGLGGWYEVQLPDKRKGWVPAGFIDLAEGYNPPVWTPPKPKFEEAHVCNTTGSIALRWSPNASSRVIEYMTPDSNFRIIDVVGEYYYVSRISGKSGYIHQSYSCEGFKVYNYGAGGGAYYDGIAWQRPFSGSATVTSPFGPRWGTMHNGTDYGLSCGTNLYSVAAGTVYQIGTNGQVLGNSSGPGTPANFVKIQHANGYMSYYWHMSTVAVEKGQRVDQGEYIGKSGNTGYVRGAASSPVSSQGCHLHFELRKNGVPFDPEIAFNAPPPQFGNGGGGSNGGSNGGQVGGESDERNNYTGYLGGNPNDKYGGNRGNNEQWPELVFDRYIRWDGATKWNELKEHRKLSAPKITFIETADDGKSVTVYGTAIPKNHPINVDVWNEYRDCWACGSGWEKKYQRESAQHVKVALFTDNWEYLGLTWNDSPDGRWKITLPLGSNLKVGDTLYAETQVMGDFEFDNLHWWDDTIENDVMFKIADEFHEKYGTWYWGSGRGNTATVPEQWIADPVERAIRNLENQLGNISRDGGIHDWCGYKVQDYNSIGGNGDSIAMYNPSHKRAYLITGGIWHSYYSNGGCGEFGLPTMNEDKTGIGHSNKTLKELYSGWYQDFEKATIYWAKHSDILPKAQPGIVKGDIRDYYHSQGGTWSDMGYPQGREWDDASECGVSGTVQNFYKGRVYSSRHGDYFVKYGREFGFYNDRGVGGNNGLGWPKSKVYYATGLSSGYGNWHFEKGVMNWDIFNIWFTEAGGCDNTSERPYDPDPNQVPQVKTIHYKEDNAFADFTRKDGGTGNGAIHKWQCGGQDIWLVDYDEVILPDGKKLGHSVVMEHQGSAYLMHGKTLYHYFDNGGCEKFGFPKTDVQVEVRPEKQNSAVVDWQDFTKSNITRYYSESHNHDYAQTNNGQVHAVTNTIAYSIYQHELLGETDRPTVNGYLGAPITGWTSLPHVAISENMWKINVPGQAFQGGWIYYDKIEGKHIKVLNELGLQKLQDDIYGKGPSNLEQFVAGLQEGLKAVFSIQDVTDVIDIALTVAAVVATGPFGTAVAVAKIVFGIAVIAKAIIEVGPLIEDILADEGTRSFMAGMIFATVAAGVVGLGFDDMAQSITKGLKSVGKVGQAINKLGGAISGKLKGVLQDMAKYADEFNTKLFDDFHHLAYSGGTGFTTAMAKFDDAVDSEAFSKFILVSKKASDSGQSVDYQKLQDFLFLLNKRTEDLSDAEVDDYIRAVRNISGDLEGLSEVDVRKIYQIATKTTVNVDEVGKYLHRITGDLSSLNKTELDDVLKYVAPEGHLFSASRYANGSDTVLGSIIDETVDSLTGKYDPDVLGRMNHILKEDPNNLTNGLHYWNRFNEVKDSYPGRFDYQIISAPTNVSPGHIHVMDLVSDKANISKSIFPSGFSIEDIAIIGQRFKQSAVFTGGPNVYELTTWYKGYQYTLQGYKKSNGEIISWFSKL